MDIHGLVNLLAPSVRPLGALGTDDALMVGELNAVEETIRLKEVTRAVALVLLVHSVANVLVSTVKGRS